MSYFFKLSLLGIGLGLAGCAMKSSSWTPSFENPQATFETWRRAAVDLDINLLVQTYSTGARPNFQRELTDTSPEGLKAMQKEAEETEFRIEKVVYEGNQAYVRVRRTRGGFSDIEILNMVKESDGWKLQP